MTLRDIKLFIGISILFAYMSIGVFGLFKLDHMAEIPMPDCPYAQNGSSLCENSFDHINNWHTFSNTVFSAIFIFTLLALGIILYFLNKQDFLNQKRYFYKWKYYLYNNNLYTYQSRIIKWLSLFENSPSLNAAHSL